MKTLATFCLLFIFIVSCNKKCDTGYFEGSYTRNCHSTYWYAKWDSTGTVIDTVAGTRAWSDTIYMSSLSACDISIFYPWQVGTVPYYSTTRNNSGVWCLISDNHYENDDTIWLQENTERTLKMHRIIHSRYVYENIIAEGYRFEGL